MTTHSRRLRDIADWLEADFPNIPGIVRSKVEALRAAADWADRVPHDHLCASRFHDPRRGPPMDMPCTCWHAEQSEPAP